MFYDWLKKGERYYWLENPNSCVISPPSWREARIISRLIKTHNKNEFNMIERKPREIRKSFFWIAKIHGKVVGSVGIIDWESDGLEIVSHLVHKKYRGRKIGKLLLEYAIRQIEKTNSASIFLFTTKPGYYQKFGFRITDPERYSRKLKKQCGSCLKSQNGPGIPPCPEIAMRYET